MSNKPRPTAAFMPRTTFARITASVRPGRIVPLLRRNNVVHAVIKPASSVPFNLKRNASVQTIPVMNAPVHPKVDVNRVKGFSHFKEDTSNKSHVHTHPPSPSPAMAEERRTLRLKGLEIMRIEDEVWDDEEGDEDKLEVLKAYEYEDETKHGVAIWFDEREEEEHQKEEIPRVRRVRFYITPTNSPTKGRVGRDTPRNVVSRALVTKRQFSFGTTRGLFTG